LTLLGVPTLPAASNSLILNGEFRFRLNLLLSSTPPGVSGEPDCRLFPLAYGADKGGIGDPLTSARRLDVLLRGVLDAERE
jgi:hypothetical protein